MRGDRRVIHARRWLGGEVIQAGHDERTRLRFSRISIARCADLIRSSASAWGPLSQSVHPVTGAPATDQRPRAQDLRPGGVGSTAEVARPLRHALWSAPSATLIFAVRGFRCLRTEIAEHPGAGLARSPASICRAGSPATRPLSMRRYSSMPRSFTAGTSAGPACAQTPGTLAANAAECHARTFGIKASEYLPGQKGPTPLSASRAAARLLVTDTASFRGGGP